MNVESAIVECMKAAQAGEPVLLLGPPGIAKSSIPFICAARLGLPYREVRPAEFEAVDFRGIPTVEGGRTKWNVPDFWPDEPCVLNVDELTQAPMELTSPLLKLFLGRSIGDYALPNGTVLIATGNNVSDKAGCSRLSSALRERCVVIHVQPDMHEWIEWYIKQPFFQESVVLFLQHNPALFHSWDAKLDFNQPNPRNWVRVSKLLPFDPAEETLAGVIGQDTARSFQAWRRANVRIPTVANVIAGYEKIPTSPSMLAKFVESAGKFVAKHIASGEKSNVDNCIELIEQCDGTFQVQFLKALAIESKVALKDVRLAKLIKRHSAALVSSQAK